MIFMSSLRLIDEILAAPLVLVILYFFWAGLLAAPGICTVEDPGLCFRLGFLGGLFVIPLAMICNPILIFRPIARAFRTK